MEQNFGIDYKIDYHVTLAVEASGVLTKYVCK